MLNKECHRGGDFHFPFDLIFCRVFTLQWRSAKFKGLRPGYRVSRRDGALWGFDYSGPLCQAGTVFTGLCFSGLALHLHARHSSS